MDDYYITYGPNKADSANVPIETVFSRGRNGTLYATQPDTGYVMTFPADATIQRENNVSEMFIAPGENVSPELRRLVSLGGARFVKVLGGSAGLPEPTERASVRSVSRSSSRLFAYETLGREGGLVRLVRLLRNI